MENQKFLALIIVILLVIIMFYLFWHNFDGNSQKLNNMETKVEMELPPLGITTLAEQENFPLSAFKSGETSGYMSPPQFLSDLLVLDKGESITFQTENKNGVIQKGPLDKWQLVCYHGDNQRQSINFDSWGDLAYKVNRYILTSRYFMANVGGRNFLVGEPKKGPLKKLGAAADYFDE